MKKRESPPITASTPDEFSAHSTTGVLRAAVLTDVARLDLLIARSGIALSAGYYSAEQAAAMTRYVYGVDSQLIADGTYFVIESSGEIVACGGWSRRSTLYGGDRAKSGPDPLLVPSREPARLRAFFVEPHLARRGLAARILAHCVHEALSAGFRALELISTLPGEPLYLAAGFRLLERFELELPGDLRVPVSRMRREIGPEVMDGID